MAATKKPKGPVGPAKPKAAPYRKVPPHFWKDRRFMAASPTAKLLYFGLLTSPLTCIVPGLVEVQSAAMLALQVGLDIGVCTAALAELEAAGLARVDRDAWVVWLPDALTWNQPSGDDVAKGWLRVWDELAPSIVKVDFLRAFTAAAEDPTTCFNEAAARVVTAFCKDRLGTVSTQSRDRLGTAPGGPVSGDRLETVPSSEAVSGAVPRGADSLGTRTGPEVGTHTVVSASEQPRGVWGGGAPQRASGDEQVRPERESAAANVPGIDVALEWLASRKPAPETTTCEPTTESGPANVATSEATRAPDSDPEDVYARAMHEALTRHPQGLSLSDIAHLNPVQKIAAACRNRALAYLQRHGRARAEKTPLRGGQCKTVWFPAVPPAPAAPLVIVRDPLDDGDDIPF